MRGNVFFDGTTDHVFFSEEPPNMTPCHSLEEFTQKSCQLIPNNGKTIVSVSEMCLHENQLDFLISNLEKNIKNGRVFIPSKKTKEFLEIYQKLGGYSVEAIQIFSLNPKETYSVHIHEKITEGILVKGGILQAGNELLYPGDIRIYKPKTEHFFYNPSGSKQSKILHFFHPSNWEEDISFLSQDFERMDEQPYSHYLLSSTKNSLIPYNPREEPKYAIYIKKRNEPFSIKEINKITNRVNKKYRLNLENVIIFDGKAKQTEEVRSEEVNGNNSIIITDNSNVDGAVKTVRKHFDTLPPFCSMFNGEGFGEEDKKYVPLRIAGIYLNQYRKNFDLKDPISFIFFISKTGNNEHVKCWEEIGDHFTERGYPINMTFYREGTKEIPKTKTDNVILAFERLDRISPLLELKEIFGIPPKILYGLYSRIPRQYYKLVTDAEQT